MNRYKHLVLFSSLSFAGLADNPIELEVIEVRAQKRVQNMQDVGTAMTAIYADTLSQFNLQDSYQLSGLSPSLLITENAGVGSPPAVSIRAVSMLDYNTSNVSPITFYFDEVPSGSVNNQFTELFDMQHVEVLRGPQGTLFGRNTSGGALLFFSQTPEEERFANITAGLGSDNYEKLQSVINLPIDKNQGLRFSVQHLDADFTGTNNLFDAPQDGIRRQTGRAQYQYQEDRFKANFILTGSNWDGISQPYGHTGVRDLVSGTQCSAERSLAGECTDFFGFNDGSTHFRDVSVDNDSPHKSEQVGASLRLRWRLQQGLSLTSISGINQLDRVHQIHCDASALDICVGFFDLDNQVTSQEFRLQKTGQQKHWILGLFYMDEDLAQDNSIDLLRDYRSFGPASGASQFFYRNQIDTESKAFFAEYEQAFGRDLTLTIGARYNIEDIRFIGNTDVNAPTPNDPQGITGSLWRVRDSISDNQWSGKLSFTYRASPDWMYYTSFNSGFKSGGFNGGFLFSPEEAQNAGYGPETLYAYEIGTKATLWQKTARFSANAFYYDYRDQQVFINQPSQLPNAPNLQLLQNVANSSIYGLESELEWQLNSHFQLNFGVSYIPTAEFDDYIDPTGAELTENRLPFAPELQTNASLQYQLDTTAGAQLAVAALYRFQSEIYFDQNQSNFTRQGGYGLWDLNLHYRLKSQWKLGLVLKNLFDKEYETLRFDLTDFLGLVNSNKGESRRVIFEVSYDFIP